MLEVKEMARVVPHEAIARDGAAIAARLGLGLEHDDARGGLALAPPVREAEARDTCADHDGVSGFAVHASLASSLVKIRRAIAIAQPYVDSTPKYDRLFDSKLCRREYGVSDA